MTSFLLSQLFLVCCWTHVGWTCVHMCLWNVRGYDVETWSLPEAGAWQFHIMLMAVLFWSLRSEHWDTGRPSCLAWHLCGYRGAKSYCLCCIANVYSWDFYPSHSDCSNTVVTRRKGHLLPHHSDCSNLLWPGGKGTIVHKVPSHVRLSSMHSFILIQCIAFKKISLFWIWRLLYEQKIIWKSVPFN